MIVPHPARPTREDVEFVDFYVAVLEDGIVRLADCARDHSVATTAARRRQVFRELREWLEARADQADLARPPRRPGGLGGVG